MANFENLVRPFQLRDITPPSRIIDTTVSTPANVTLSYGDAATDPKVVQISSNTTISYYMDTKGTADASNTSIVRVSNPNDKSQFVDMERIDKQVYKEGAGQYYKKVKENVKVPNEAGKVEQVLFQKQY
jgi:hypothetical protein